MLNPTIVRLFISQAFACYFLIILVPIKPPIKNNRLIIISGMLLITLANAIMIQYLGLSDFYIRYFFITLLLPNFLLYSYFAIYKYGKLLFALLSIQVFGNVAIVNGILASYLTTQKDNPLLDTSIRVITYLFFFPLVHKFIQPQYLKMVKTLNKGWWILNLVLVISYMLSYYIGFVPTPVLYRPQYFIHLYVGLFLGLSIYVVLFFLFVEIESKISFERDKQLLSIQVASLEQQSQAIAISEEKIAIIKHDLRHHLSIINELILTKDLTQATQYLEGLDQTLSEVSPKFYCKNKVINAALSHYLNYASLEQIEVISNLDIPANLPINPSELAIVFSNAIENAIQACLRIPEASKRLITLTSRYKNDSLFLEISNTCFEAVIFSKDGIPISSKQGHGIGVQSMVAFSKANHAILDFSLEDNTFYVRLILNF